MRAIVGHLIVMAVIIIKNTLKGIRLVIDAINKANQLPERKIGTIQGEECNRDGCPGTIYKYWWRREGGPVFCDTCDYDSLDDQGRDFG